jgi:hypothetical protein
VYVTGSFTDTVDFDPGSGVDNHSSNGNNDVFVSKFGSTGNFLWTRTWGGTDDDFVYSITTDASGNVYVTGRYGSTVDFDPGSGVDNHTSKGGQDAFLSKFGSDGNFIWARTWGGTDWDWGDCGHSVAADASGNVYVTGFYESTVDFDPGSGVDNHTSNGLADAFLVRFLPDGNW